LVRSGVGLGPGVSPGGRDGPSARGSGGRGSGGKGSGGRGSGGRGSGGKGGSGRGAGGRSGSGDRSGGRPAGGGRRREVGAEQRGGPAGRRGILEDRIVGGLHPVRELLRSGHDVTRVLIAVSRDPVLVLDEIEALAAERGVAVERHDRPVLDALAEGLVHQGVVALGPPVPVATLDEVLAAAERAGEAPLLVALDGVTDPHNLGSIARTAEAVGAHGLLVPERRAAGITPSAEKAAAGALAHLPVVPITNLARTLRQLHDAGVWSLGLDGDAEVAIADHPLASEPCVLVVGAEGSGLARLTRDRCDALVRLPMRGQVGSLNASVAAAVALYTLLDRRG
jgi:23S rRNA (guanosine2251-2'-O)-methyltransferase